MIDVHKTTVGVISDSVMSATSQHYLSQAGCFPSGLCVCVRNISKSYERILTKYFRGARHGLRTNQLDSGGNVNHNPDSGFVDPYQETFNRFLTTFFLTGTSPPKEQ